VSLSFIVRRVSLIRCFTDVYGRCFCWIVDPDTVTYCMAAKTPVHGSQLPWRGLLFRFFLAIFRTSKDFGD
jgi:hypothetical protein